MNLERMSCCNSEKFIRASRFPRIDYKRDCDEKMSIDFTASLKESGGLSIRAE